MSKTVIRITPYGGYDIPGLEGWLAAMAGKGLRFSMTTGPLTFFDRAEAETVQVHLEPIQRTPEENPELNALYEEAGWRYLGMFRGSFYVFASPDLQAQAHTDPDTLGYALRRFFRGKLASGLLLAFLNVLLLGLYSKGAFWNIDWIWLRYYPVEHFTDYPILPFLLAALGLFLVDLSYLLGLVHLLRYRRAVKRGDQPRGHRGVGWLLAAGLLVLLPVLVNTVQCFAGMDYRPYDLEGSGFVTLQDLEGEDLRISQALFYNMDYISHGGTLLDPEYWYFQQYASFGTKQSPNDVPHLEISITRYPLEVLAELRAAEYRTYHYSGSGDYQDLEPVHGLDEAWYAVREGRTVNTESGLTRLFLPGGVLILRRGNTVLLADYYGSQDLSLHLEQFAQMLEGL